MGVLVKREVRITRWGGITVLSSMVNAPTVYPKFHLPCPKPTLQPIKDLLIACMYMVPNWVLLNGMNMTNVFKIWGYFLYMLLVSSSSCLLCFSFSFLAFAWGQAKSQVWGSCLGIFMPYFLGVLSAFLWELRSFCVYLCTSCHLKGYRLVILFHFIFLGCANHFLGHSWLWAV